MNDFHRGLYVVVVFGAFVSGAWAWIMCDSTPSRFIDVYSLSGEEREQVSLIAQEQFRSGVLPIAVIALLTLGGWGYCLFGRQEPRSKG